MSAKLVDTPTGLLSFLHHIDASAEARAKPLFVDLEGVKLSRQGTISLVTIMHGTSQPVYLVDVVALGRNAFNLSNARGTTLRSILESSSVTKVFFDVRRDSEALFHLFQVRLRGIQDLQLMEVATRRFKKTFLMGLSKCIEKERDLHLSTAERQRWQRVKEQGHKLFQPDQGGSYEVFNARPLSPEIEQYCIQDVILMPRLLAIYSRKLAPSRQLRQRVEDETKTRIAESHVPASIQDGQARSKAPAIFSVKVNARPSVSGPANAHTKPASTSTARSSSVVAKIQGPKLREAGYQRLQDGQPRKSDTKTVAKDGDGPGGHEKHPVAAVLRDVQESAQARRRFAPPIRFRRGSSFSMGSGSGVGKATSQLDALALDDNSDGGDVLLEGLRRFDDDNDDVLFECLHGFGSDDDGDGEDVLFEHLHGSDS